MNAAYLFAVQQLAASGFAPLHTALAHRLRPDITGPSLSLGFGEARTHLAIRNLPGVLEVTMRVEGFDDPITVLTRSTSRLEERFAEIVGLPARAWTGQKPAGRWTGRQRATASADSVAAAAPPRALVRTPRMVGNLYPGLTTAVRPSSCSNCERHSYGECRASAASGLRLPDPHALRYCAAFRANDDDVDSPQRDGLARWPELAAATPLTLHAGG